MERIPSAARAVAAVVVLAGALAATAHGSVWSPARVGVASPVVLAAIVAASFGICLGLGAAWSTVRHSRSAAGFSAVLPGAVVAAALLSLYLISQTELEPHRIAPAEQVEDDPVRTGDGLESDWRGPAERRGGREDERLRAVVGSDIGALLRRLLAFIGLTTLAALLLARRAGRRGGPRGGGQAPGGVERAAAHGAVVRTIQAMLEDADPRTAIIGAYARLLEALDANGASRRAYEGPSEHLVRVLGTLDARPGALKSLVRLFQLARFSDHTLTAAHRSDALVALRDIAEDLGAPPPPVTRAPAGGPVP